MSGETASDVPGPGRIRLDKWLWHARFFKTRSLATRQILAGHLRVNGTRTAKPAVAVGSGDTLTFPRGDRVRVVRILAAGQRRGPAPEAQALYEDLSPLVPCREAPVSNPAYDLGGRPTKKDRRRLDQSRFPPLE